MNLNLTILFDYRAVQGILRVTKNPSAEVKTVLGESTLLKIKKKMFGKTNRMPSSSKDELEDILLVSYLYIQRIETGFFITETISNTLCYCRCYIGLPRHRR